MKGEGTISFYSLEIKQTSCDGINQRPSCYWVSRRQGQSGIAACGGPAPDCSKQGANSAVEEYLSVQFDNSVIDKLYYYLHRAAIFSNIYMNLCI